MYLTKIKYNGERVIIEAQTLDDESKLSVICDSKDQPEFEFTDALDNLRKVFLDILEMPTTKADQKKLTVHTINFSYKGTDRIPHVILSANFHLSNNQSYNVNTPIRTLESVDVESSLLLNADARQAIETMKSRATEYLNGKRSQLNLFAA